MIWPAIALIAAIVVAVVVGAVLLHKALTDSRADADKNFGTNPVGCPTQGCPLVKWVWDDPHTKDRRQYVNLPADWDPAKNGTAVELVGHVEPRKSGETVTFSIIPNAGNEPDTGAASLSATSITTGDNGVGKVTLTLPHYGGAKFKVSGKTAPQDKPAESGELWVWRKVFYQKTDMANSPAPENLSLAAPGDMISAHSSLSEDEQRANVASELLPVHQIESLAAGETTQITGEFRLPFNRIRPIRKGKAALFVPLARLKVNTADGGNSTVLLTALVGQRSREPGAGLQPFRLDFGPRIYREVTQRIF